MTLYELLSIQSLLFFTLTTHLHSRPFSSSSQSRSSLLFIFTQPHRKSLCHPPQAHCSTRPGLRLASCRCTWVPFSVSFLLLHLGFEEIEFGGRFLRHCIQDFFFGLIHGEN
ncbi:hypothetical protein AAZX31_02G220900 [Glycine max]